MFTEKWNTDNTLGTEITLEDQVTLGSEAAICVFTYVSLFIVNPTSEFLFCSACTWPEADL